MAPDEKPSSAEIAQLVAMCISEQWTAATRSCVGGVKTSEEVGPCLTGREATTKKRSEADLNLSSIEKANEREYAETASFVAGSAGPSPGRSCCSYPNKRCPPTASDWNQPAWLALDFEMTIPAFFQYSYKSDGRTYEARAVGDLDCDGQTVTYILRGRAGSPAELIRPTNVD